MIGDISPFSWQNFIHNSIRNGFQVLKFKKDALKLSAQSLVQRVKIIKRFHSMKLETLRSTTRAVRKRGLNSSSKMSALPFNAIKLS